MADQVNETVDSRRSFIDPIGGKMFYLAAPTAEHIRGADWQYSKVYTKSLVEGITTAAEMMDILMRRGIIGPEFEQRQKELTDELATKVAILRSTEDMHAKQRLALEVASMRDELFNWNQRLNGPMSNTCEQMADDSRLEFLVSCMVQDSEGKRIWDDYSDFLREKNQSFAMRARFETMLYLQGLDSDFLERTPEAVALREIEADVREKAQQAISDLEAAEEAERVVEDLQVVPEEKPVKRSRKKSEK
jgi:hypothetical protein